MAILKDLIVQGASRFIGDAYFATIKAGVWNGTPIDLSHGGTAGETTAGKILTSTTTSGTSAWTAASSITVGTATTATKLSTVSKTAWGQTYWTSGGVPTSISGTIDPGNNVTSSCGTSSHAWLNVYTSNIVSNTTLYIESAANTSIIFKPQGTPVGRFNTKGKLVLGKEGTGGGANDIQNELLYVNGNTVLNGATTLGSANTDQVEIKGYLNVSSITSASVNISRPIWFSYAANSSGYTVGRPAYHTSFTYNPSTGTVSATTFSGSLSGNATTATTLQTSHNIWGQSFNGSADVTGNMTGVTNIDSLLYFDTTNSRIGINKSDSSYALDVNGDIYTNSNIYINGKLVPFQDATTTTAGLIFASTTTEGKGNWLSIIQGNCMTISTTNSNITVGVSEAYKSVLDYYAKTAYYENTLSVSPTTYDKGASSVSITVTLTPKKEGAAYTTTESDTATYGASSSMGTAMTRNVNTFTATYTFTPTSSSGNITFYGQSTLGGITLTKVSKAVTMQQKVYYGKSTKKSGLTATDLADTTNFKTVMASAKGSPVTNIPAGNGTTEYWWFATPFTFSQMQNTTTYETSGCQNTGETLTMNNSTYYLWRTTSVAATVSQNWKIGL